MDRLDAADGITDASGHRLPEPLDGLRPRGADAAAEPDRSRQLVDESVVLHARSFSPAQVVGGLRLLEVFGQLDQALAVGGDGAPVEGLVAGTSEGSGDALQLGDVQLS